MALIYIYDASDIDRQQLGEGLSSTDHHWEFIEDSISSDNLNPETEVISVFVSSVVSREIIEKLPRLKLIACRSTGFNNIDLQAASERGITVANVPTYGEATVAEYAFTLMLALNRKLPESLDFLGHELDTRTLIGSDLNGKTLGVVGSGHIGQHVIKIAKGFEMRVVAYDPYPNEKSANELGYEYVELEDLLKNSDIVSLHAPFVPENYHLINAERLKLMKPSAILVNTARGELVDSQALVQALKDKTIAGAALDVLEEEKLENLDEEVALLRSHKLTSGSAEKSVALLALNKLDNVILTPHNAFNTIEAVGRINSTTCQNMIRYWYGEVPNKVESKPPGMGKLVLVRHAESEWNMLGRWTGQTNISLSDKGFHEATLLGLALEKLGIKFDQAYSSEQVRTLETLEIMLNAAQQLDVPFERRAAINERDYGDYTAKNKWDMEKLVGNKEFEGIRRGWNHPVPGGETLKMVYERVLPFYKDEVLSLLKQGKNILVCGHGNSLRALTKYIEKLSDQAIEETEMMFGKIVVYEVDDKGQIINKSETKIDSPPPNA